MAELEWSFTPALPGLPPRWALPPRRESRNFAVTINYGDYQSTYQIGVAPPAGPPGEFFVCGGVKQGSPRFWDIQAGAWMLSVLLQVGVPLGAIREAVGGSVYAHAIDEAMRLRAAEDEAAGRPAVHGASPWLDAAGACRECGAAPGAAHRVTCGAHRERPGAA